MKKSHICLVWDANSEGRREIVSPNPVRMYISVQNQFIFNPEERKIIQKEVDIKIG